MRRKLFCFVAMTAALILGQTLHLGAQGQPGARLGPGSPFAIGLVKSLSNTEITLTQTRDLRNPAAPPSEMTFVITSSTAFQNRDMIRPNTGVTVAYTEQNGKLIATNVSSLGINPIPGGPATSGYGATVPYPSAPPAGPAGRPASPTNPLPPASSRGSQPVTGDRGACQYSAGPCLSSPAPQLLPASTGHDFISLRQQADAIAQKHSNAKIYKVHLDYQNDAVWGAEFDYVTAPSGKVNRSRWGDCRVHIDPANGNVRQYQAVDEFNDQMDEPPPVAPENLVNPWETVRSMNIPNSIRHSQGSVQVELRQVGALHRMVRLTDEKDYMAVVARTAAHGQWVWVANWPYPADPSLGGSIFQIVYLDAGGGRPTSECTNMAGRNENNWTVMSCPAATDESRRSNPPPFGGGLSNSQNSQRLQCNNQGKNCRPVN